MLSILLVRNSFRDEMRAMMHVGDADCVRSFEKVALVLNLCFLSIDGSWEALLSFCLASVVPVLCWLSVSKASVKTSHKLAGWPGCNVSTACSAVVRSWLFKQVFWLVGKGLQSLQSQGKMIMPCMYPCICRSHTACSSRWANIWDMLLQNKWQ